MVNATKNPATRFRPIPRYARPRVIGIDFSGASESGKTAWAAELELLGRAKPTANAPTANAPLFRLVSLLPLGKLAGGDDRDVVNAYLVDRISCEDETLWGCDFPFGLPQELELGPWEHQLAHVTRFSGAAKDYGHLLVERTERLLGAKHVRRATDRETKTPFDCYHYRIIYQTFHGMRDVLGPLVKLPRVAVLPFQYEKASRLGGGSIVVEACPSSTLKRLDLPHQRYKQSGGKVPQDHHRKTRRRILARVTEQVEISRHRRGVIMNDPGGDALDAVLAGLGAWMGVASAKHRDIADDPRYPHEGYVYC